MLFPRTSPIQGRLFCWRLDFERKTKPALAGGFRSGQPFLAGKNHSSDVDWELLLGFGGFPLVSVEEFAGFPLVPLDVDDTTVV